MNLETKLAANARSGMIGAVLTLICGFGLWWFQLGQPLSNLSYDLLFVFVQQAVTNDVIIVKMDDAARLALNETSGLWKRKTHARLLDKLRKDQSAMAVFDVLFADPGDKQDNAEFARAIKAHGNVVLAAGLEIDAACDEMTDTSASLAMSGFS